jgi:hypothetical protein
LDNALNLPSGDGDQLQRFLEAQQRELTRLQLHFRGAVRVQLKPLAAAIGIAASTVRNNFNTLRINGKEIRPSQVCGRVTFDLEEVAHALALGAIQAPPPARVVRAKGAETEPQRKRGRIKKPDLAVELRQGGQP